MRDSGVISTESVLALYPQPAHTVLVFYCDAAAAIKVSFPRPHPSGSPEDSDVFGGQQYAPLLDLEVEVG